MKPEQEADSPAAEGQAGSLSCICQIHWARAAKGGTSSLLTPAPHSGLCGLCGGAERCPAAQGVPTPGPEP